MFLKSKSKLRKTIDFLYKQSTKKIEWYGFRRWVRIHRILGTIDYLLVNSHTDKETEEILLKLYVQIKNTQKKMQSNVMPLKAFKILLKPIKIIDKNIKK